MKNASEKRLTLTGMVEDGAYMQALSFAVSHRFPKTWQDRCLELYMESIAEELEAASLPVAKEDDIVTKRRIEIMEEMREEKRKKNNMSRSDAKASIKNMIRLKDYQGVYELAERFGQDILSKNYTKPNSAYSLWLKRVRMELIGNYRYLSSKNPSEADKFKRKHNIKDEELNRWGKK